MPRSLYGLGWDTGGDYPFLDDAIVPMPTGAGKIPSPNAQDVLNYISTEFHKWVTYASNASTLVDPAKLITASQMSAALYWTYQKAATGDFDTANWMAQSIKSGYASGNIPVLGPSSPNSGLVASVLNGPDGKFSLAKLITVGSVLYFLWKNSKTAPRRRRR